MWAKQNQSEDVKLLSNQVNERLRQAIEKPIRFLREFTRIYERSSGTFLRGRDRQ